MEKIWIKHDINAHKDDKIIALVSRHELKGYGAYWLFNEILTEAKAKGNIVDMSKPYMQQAVAEKMKIEINELMELLESMVEFELVQCEDGIYSSLSLDKRTKFLKNTNRSEIGRKAANARWSNHKKKEQAPKAEPENTAEPDAEDDGLDFGEDNDTPQEPVAETKGKKKGGKSSRKDFVFEETHDFFKDADFKLAFDQFTAMRVKAKKPMTDYAKHLMIIDVDKKSKGNSKMAAAIFNQSTKATWTDIYEFSADKQAAVQTSEPKYRNEAE